MNNICDIIRFTLNKKIDVGSKSVTKSFHSKPVMEATRNMTLDEQEALIRPFLTVENRLHLEVKCKTILQSL